MDETARLMDELRRLQRAALEAQIERREWGEVEATYQGIGWGRNTEADLERLRQERAHGN